MIGQLVARRVLRNSVVLTTTDGIGIGPEASGNYSCIAYAIETLMEAVNVVIVVPGGWNLPTCAHLHIYIYIHLPIFDYKPVFDYRYCRPNSKFVCILEVFHLFHDT